MSFVGSRAGGFVLGSSTGGAAGKFLVTDPPMASVPAPGVANGPVAWTGVVGMLIVGSSALRLQPTTANTAHAQPATMAVRRIASEPRSHAGDEFFHPFVDGAERVLAENRALRLVVELQVHPVHGEVAATLLRPLDELPAQPRPRCLRRHRLRLEDRDVAARALDCAALLQQVVKAAVAVDIVVGEVDLRDPRRGQWEVVLGAVPLDQLVLDDP